MHIDFDQLRKDLEVWERGEQSAPREWAQAYVDLQNATPDLARLALLVPELREAMQSVMVGGNHLGLVIGDNHPAYTENHESARKHYGTGFHYEAWCAWKTIMHARAALAKLDALLT